MDCSRLPSMYSARLDQELTRAEQAAFDDHLAACADCHRQWRLFQATVERLGALQMMLAPPDLLPGILAAVAEERRAGERRYVAEPSLVARLLVWWQRRDFSVSVPTAAATVATAMILAVLVHNSMIPWPLPGGGGEVAGDPALNVGAFAGLSGERPRLPLPEATLAATSSRSYSALGPPKPSLVPSAASLSRYDVVPAHQAAFSGAAFPGAALPRADMLVVFRADQGDGPGRLFRECNAQSSWRVEYSDQGVMLLDLPPCELPVLRKLLAEQSVTIAPLAALSPDFGRDRESLRVAIRFRP